MSTLSSTKPNASGEPSPSFFDSPLGKLLIALGGLTLTVLFFIWGFNFLRTATVPLYILTPFAIIWGVGGVALMYTFSNMLVEQFPRRWLATLQPYIFIGPAVLILFWYLAFPTFRTLWISFFSNEAGPPEASIIGDPAQGNGWQNFQQEFSKNFVGLKNYQQIFSGDNNNMRVAFRNNLYWILFGASASVIFGLLIAILADRSQFENLAKAIIFLPMAISFVGAGVIWNFIYEYRPAGEPQIGLANAILTFFGAQPQTFAQSTSAIGLNNIFLIIILVWLQTGYAMVLFSAAIKGVPSDLLEAARVDGASEIQIFFSIIIPVITGTIITVTTTVVIATLKVFDVVWVMTGGQYDTQVIGTQFYRESFTSGNSGTGSALAIILLLAVVPVMIYNLRDFSKRRTF
jgi:alpha-glucoside transport system permease protein